MERCKIFDPYTKFSEHDLILNKRFSEIRKQIHLAFSDSINTPTIMDNMHQLISTTNIYVYTPNINLNGPLLRNIADYITRLLSTFGLNFSASPVGDLEFIQSTEQQSSTVNVRDIDMLSIEQFALFQDAARAQATAFENKEMITLNDDVTHEISPESVEDQSIN